MTTPDPNDYRDRRTGLILFGILEVLIGVACALVIPLVLFAQTLASRRTGGAPAPFGIVPTVTVYALLATAFIWLGIGSMLARRWARAILLCGSAVGLGVGAMAITFVALMLPRMGDIMVQPGQPAPPPAAVLIVKIFMVVFILVAYLVIPGALFLFYRSPHVKRTCEVRDPVERWTDRSPLPVLAYSLVMALGGICLLSLLAGRHPFPLFGILVSGGAGSIVVGLVAGLVLYVAWGLYRLRTEAWWIALGIQVIFGIASFVTFWRSSFTALYLKMGFDQRTALTAGHLLDQPVFHRLIPFSCLPWLVWLFCLRRYFTPPGHGVTCEQIPPEPGSPDGPPHL